ncbi:MAG TPA: thiamine phosphate synthase [Vicinamibacteria bacterium]|jgi:thiamine-phosphate pyrophosphorylase
MVTAPEPSLTLVSDRRRLPGADLAALAAAAAVAGVDWIQVREKDLPDGALLRLARAVVEAVARTRARVLVNGRPDVAELAGAHGVQLPEEGLPVAEVKRCFPRLIVGASRHSLDGARRAEAEGADFVLLGPVFPTPGKNRPPLGLGTLAEVASALRVPVHAIGGVSAENAGAARHAGARGLAAIRPFLEPDVACAVRALRAAATAGEVGPPSA